MTLEVIMERRKFMKYLAAGGLSLCLPLKLVSGSTTGVRIALTFDDPHHRHTPLLDPLERNYRILDTLDSHSELKSALFVSGANIDSEEGEEILGSWNERNHILGNHSYSHLYLNSPDIGADRYAADILRCEDMIKDYEGFRRIFRYPYLKAGDTETERDAIYAFLREHGYKIGHVTVDTSDWYIDQRLTERLSTNPRADILPYRDYYVNHLLGRIEYYNTMAENILDHPIPHVILLHHNLINALFLPDLMAALDAEGHTIIDAEEAFADEIYSLMPEVMPAGESLIFALAMHHEKYAGKLRYPTESAKYEENAMDSLGL